MFVSLELKLKILNIEMEDAFTAAQKSGNINISEGMLHFLHLFSSFSVD